MQSDGDLGAKITDAFSLHCATGPLLLIGTDCPPLSPMHLRQAAEALLRGNDAVFIPSEDGGYALVGLHEPQPALFEGVPWSTSSVMRATLERASSLGLCVELLDTLWDVDVPWDLLRLERLSEAKASHAEGHPWSAWHQRVRRAAASFEAGRSTTAAQTVPATED
jgi:glycosyltransferase A (GT-A) superfamily protein (DUF2064 family)